IARIKDKGRCNFADVAGELPLFVICEILGVPHEHRERLYGLTARMFASEIVDPDAAFADGMAAANELRDYGAELCRHKRASPGEDMMSDLVAAELDGRHLTEGELQAFFQLLFNAGADTTRSLLCFGLDLLLDRPDVVESLRREPTLLPSAI